MRLRPFSLPDVGLCAFSLNRILLIREKATKAAELRPPSVVGSAQASPAASGTLSNTGIPEQKSVSGGSDTSSPEPEPVPSLFDAALSEKKATPGTGSSDHKPVSSLFAGFGTGLSKQKTVSGGSGTAPSEHKPVPGPFGPALPEQKPISGDLV
jgi:hypothetical protein